MAQNFLVPERDQVFLLPPSMAEWLPQDHLAFFVIDAVEEMDLSTFYADYRGDGRGGAAHHPSAMVALLLYAYCLGVRSSRQIERACHVDVAFRVIAAGLFPDHTTIARFRKRHVGALKSIFIESLKLCKTAGMTSVGLVAVDGTKIAANASLSANRTKESIDKVVDEMFKDADATDQEEDAEFGDARGDEQPADLRGREDRKRRFKAAKHQIDKDLEDERRTHEDHLAKRAEQEAQAGTKLRGRKPKDPADKAGAKEKRANTTDPDSKVMSTANGFVQGYNAQAVANEEQVIVAAEVTDEHNDHHQLHPMIDATAATLKEAGIEDTPTKLLADAGYANEENFEQLNDDGPDAYIATRNMKKNKAPRTGSRGPLRKGATLTEKMDRKVSRKEGRDLYRHRQHIIEPVFGQIKEARGIRRFSRRGKEAADAEWKLIAGTHNLLKLYRRALVDPTAAPFTRMATA